MMDLQCAPEINLGQRKYHHSDGFQKSIPSTNVFVFGKKYFGNFLIKFLKLSLVGL